MTRTIAQIGLLLCLLGSFCLAEVVYTNDFGTSQQFGSLTWTTIGGGAGTGALDREGPLSGPVPPGDLDGDGKYETVVEDTGFGTSRGTAHLFAPLFHTMSNITVSGYGKGFSGDWTSGARWRISYDGDDWTHDIGSDNSNTWKPYSISTGVGDPNYTNIAEVWVCTEVYSGSGTYNPSVSGRSGALQVEADIAPGEAGQRVPIHLNDFGTQQQRDEWLLSGPMEYVDGGIDTDADGMSAYLVTVSPGTCIAMIRVTAPEGLAFKDPIATGRGYGSKATHDSFAQIRLSLNGYDWDVASTYPSTPPGWYADDIVADATGLAQYQAVESFWLQLHMFSFHQSYLPKISSVVVTAEMVEGTEPSCGDGSVEFMRSDLSGPEGQPDCYVDMYDLMYMASQWLDSTDAE